MIIKNIKVIKLNSDYIELLFQAYKEYFNDKIIYISLFLDGLYFPNLKEYNAFKEAYKLKQIPILKKEQQILLIKKEV